MISKIVGSFVRSLPVVLAVALSSALFQGTSAQAGMISGSDAFSQQNNVSIGALPGGTNVNTATSFTNVAPATSSMATGDFLTYVPANTDISAGVTVPVATGASTFTIGNVAFGTFTATSETVVFQGSGFANLTFQGTFTPGSLFPGGSTATPAILGISFTQTTLDGPISESGTISTAAVPEPSSIALLGIGLSAFIAFRRRLSKKHSAA
jgi:hypothetical protein